MNITNDRPVTIYKFKDNDKIKYTFGVGKKKQNSEEYDNAFYPIQFSKGIELEDRQKIKIKNAWLSFYSWEYDGKKGNTFYVMCNDFDYVNDDEAKVETKVQEDPFAAFGNMVSTDNDFLD